MRNVNILFNLVRTNYVITNLKHIKPQPNFLNLHYYYSHILPDRYNLTEKTVMH